MAATQALSVNGSGYASKTAAIAGLASGNLSTTVCMWFQPSSQPADGFWFPTLSVGAYAADGDTILPAYIRSGANFQLMMEVKNSQRFITNPLTTGTWYWLCFVTDGTAKTTEVFVNNVSIGTMSAQTPATNINPTKIFLGQRADTNAATFANGIFQDVRYFEVQISSGNRGTIYNSGAGTYTAIGTEKLWYKCDGTYNDASGNGNALAAGGTGNSFVTGKIVTTLTDSITSYWKFEGNVNDSVASNNLTDTGTSDTASGRILRGRSLVNTNVAKVNLTPAAEFTVNIWVYRTDNTNNKHFFGWGNGPGGDYITSDYETSFSGYILKIAHAGESSINSSAVSANAWHMVTITRTGTTYEFFIDGVSQGTQTKASVAITTNFGIGYTVDTVGTNTMICVVDEMGLWARQLTGTEITQLYNGGAGLTYPFTSSSNSSNAIFFRRGGM
jgi:hypothetical protein